MNRRSFIKITALGTGVAGMGVFHACSDNDISNDGELISSFQQLSVEAKPFTRWWWNGNVLNKDEISRELNIMQQAGLGGVEITPIAMPVEGTVINQQPITWLSDEWLEILKYTCEKAESLNMKTDMIVGTGWPFGGDFLAPDETIQGIQQKVIELDGPGEKLVNELLPDAEYNSRLMQVKLISQACKSADEALDLTDQVEENQLALNIPVGKHYLHIVSWRQNYDQVYFGAPGGEGPVLDHFNREAVRKYLTRTSERLHQVFPQGIGKYIRSMFCDSIELHGANWTTDFSQEFETRRGYQVEPYLPFILAKDTEYPNMQKEIASARYDFYRTLSELFMERFLQEFHQWCQEIGVKSRYQAYGFPYLYTHMTDGSMVPDIPEGDQFLFNGSWQRYANINDIRYAVWNKYAAAGGKLAKRPIVSTEAMSNLKGVFQATLALHKQATDLDFVAGINHLILHGYNYSPPEAGFPGWMRFGTYYSDQNTWWPHFHHWSNFTARVSSVLQKASPATHIGLLSPIEETWAESGFSRDAYNYNPWYLHAIWQAFNHNGCISDYLSPDVVVQSTVSDRQLVYNGAAFSALVVCSADYLRSDVAAKLEEMAGQGVQIIFLGDLPERLIDFKNEVKKPFQNPDVFSVYPAPDQDKHAAPKDLADFTSRLIQEMKIKPLLQVSEANQHFFFQQADFQDQKIFYLVNSSEKEHLSLSVKLPVSTNDSLVYCQAETGELFNYPHQQGHVNLKLLPTGSLLLISKASPADKNYKLPGETINKIIPKNNWQVKLQPVAGEALNLTLEELQDFSQLEKFRDFAGTIIYQAAFELQDTDWQYLDLQETTDSVAITINGQPAGVRWHRGQLLPVEEGLLKKGSNQIELVVKTTLFNYARTLKDNAMAMKWVNMANSQELVPTGLVSPIILRKQHK